MTALSRTALVLAVSTVVGCALALALASCGAADYTMVQPQAAAPAPVAAINNAQATLQAAGSMATQQAQSTQSAYNATDQAISQARAMETQRVAQATQGAQSAAATSTANIRETWDAATSTAGAMQLQSTGLASTQIALMAQSTHQAADIQASQTAIHAELSAALDATLMPTRAYATAVVLQTDADYRHDRGYVWLTILVIAVIVLAWLIIVLSVIVARTIDHRQLVYRKQLEATIQVAGLLKEPATPVQRIPAPQINSYKPSTTKEHAMKWIDRSITFNGRSGTQLIGWPGATADQVRSAMQSAGLVDVRANSGTFCRAGTLDQLRARVEQMDDTLSPTPPASRS